ncbi:site-specific DNA-methyltransferase [Dehalococcoidia bacterium]|nr:site-specific DNA-methyltransferase [Dehalococcoidia bacterium]
MKMDRRRKHRDEQAVGDYRYDQARRKNNPPVGIAPSYEVRERKTISYAYDPHLDPQLQWAGKAEHTSFEVDLVSLHIHERISTKAILRAVQRPEPVQLSLFADPQLPLDRQIEFYQHDVNWTNRLILGDSLLVMNSLLIKEGMAGKVQMIYVDPPYGIKYSSNFQPRIDRRDVKDIDEDLTREPEQIKAYRDTWKLGIHSYLTYLRDRLLLCRDLLHESGSIFVQMNDENLHLVRSLMDEVFGRENFVAVITFTKTRPLGAVGMPGISDYLLWYAKGKSNMKYHQLFISKEFGEGTNFTFLELPDGSRRKMTREETIGPSRILSKHRVFQCEKLASSGYTATCYFEIDFEGKTFPPKRTSWRTNQKGMEVLKVAGRLYVLGNNIYYVSYFDDYPVQSLPNLWSDTRGEMSPIFTVQTNTKVIERCILMTTDPGDLVFDPTCGSGTTAYCAEKWGRRWVTCDTSRVALAIARQRLMTAKFDYYELADPEKGVSYGFVYETVPHITLESIAKNTEIDTIAEKYHSRWEELLAKLSKALGGEVKDWEVPRGKPPEDWNSEVKELWRELDDLRRRRQKEIDDSIQRHAPQEVLYDRPRVNRGVIRVSGPFTVEAIPVPVIEEPTQAPIPQFEEDEARHRIANPAGNYLTNVIELLRKDGVTFPGGRKMPVENLRLLNIGFLHAEGETKQNGKPVRVAVSFGPQYGPVTATQVAEAIPVARNNAYDLLIFAGFSFDPEAQAFVQKAPVKDLSVHFVNIAPDVLVGDLLKTTRSSQLFTVFGQPDVKIDKQKDGTYIVTLLGIDIYNPNTGELSQVRGEDVAAWFLDTDYDGMTFHICQAFFPGGQNPWDKLQRALKARIDPEAFEQMQGTQSFSFQANGNKRIAVKVIDFRGNEVMRVLPLEGVTYDRHRR